MAETNLTPHRKVPGHETAIVFVHGYWGDAEKTWGQFPELLAADSRLSDWDIYSLGYPTGLLPDIVGIWKAKPNLDAVADTLRTTTAIKLKGYQSITWIAHSMGGLVVQRALVDDDGFASKVGYVFLFGTPSDGLVKASFFKFWQQQLDHMAKDGAFVVDLRKRWTQNFIDHPPPFKFFVTAGDQDEFVPRQASLGPFLSSLRKHCFVIPGDHLSIVKPTTSEHLGLQLVLNGLTENAAAIAQGNAARVAVEMRQFHHAITLLEPNQDKLDERGLVQLALAYEGIGRQRDAIKLLETVRGDTDAMGVLAGRLKRRWLVEQQRDDAERARDLYAEGFKISAERNDALQAFYHGINLAFMTLAFGDKPEIERQTIARQLAQQVIEYCAQAPVNKWRLATEGEAKYVLGEKVAALGSYEVAVHSKPAPTPRELDSMYQQAIRLTSIFGDEDTANRLNTIFGR